MKMPRISAEFVQDIESKATQGTYRVLIGDIIMDVFPYVFPPSSPFSKSTKTVYADMGNLTGKSVLDIGTGTGIQAIMATKAGATEIHAVDIYQGAVDCCKHNVMINSLQDKIAVYQSDLFSNVPEQRFDLIIANLPIVDAPEKRIEFLSLFDPGFKYHERLFAEAYDYLAENGCIVLCHANLHEESGFGRLEAVAARHGFIATVKQKVIALGHEWRTYEFKKEVK